MNRLFLVIGAAIALAGVTTPQAADAATVTKGFYQAGSGFCQPALPTFDGNIRKRPTAIANEGTALAFVSCSAPKTFSDANGFSDNEAQYQLIVYNKGSAAVDVTCSLVNSFQAGSTTFPKTLSVAAGGRTFFRWDATTDNGGTEWQFPNFSCGLPPGTEVGYILYNFDSEIGA